MQRYISDKVDKFSLDSKYQVAVSKFLGTLAITSGIDEKKKLLEENGIVIKKPSQFIVFFCKLEEIQNTINEFNELGEIGLLQKDPSLIRSKGLAKRIKTSIENGVSYKNEKGSLDGSVRWPSLFKIEPQAVLENTNTDSFVFEEEKKDEIISNESRVVDENTLVTDLEKIYNQNPVDLIVENSSVETNLPDEEVNLSAPLEEDSIPFTDETFEKFNELLDVIRKVLVEAYNQLEVPDRIINDLSIYVKTRDISDHINDKSIIYDAIAGSVIVSQEDRDYLENIIGEHLQNGRSL